MNPRTAILLSLPALLLGCAHGRVDTRQATAPVAAPPSSPPAPAASPVPTPQSTRIDFETQVRPMLQDRCSPCHFPGGRMYDKLPFDREETIRKLGKALFTRLRDPVDLELLRSFLDQPKDGSAAPSSP